MKFKFYVINKTMSYRDKQKGLYKTGLKNRKIKSQNDISKQKLKLKHRSRTGTINHNECYLKGKSFGTNLDHNKKRIFPTRDYYFNQKLKPPDLYFVRPFSELGRPTTAPVQGFDELHIILHMRKKLRNLFSRSQNACEPE